MVLPGAAEGYRGSVDGTALPNRFSTFNPEFPKLQPRISTDEQRRIPPRGRGGSIREHS